MDHISREKIHLDQIRFIRHKVHDLRRIYSFAEWELYQYATFIPHSHTRYLREILRITRDLALHDLNILDDIINRQEAYYKNTKLIVRSLQESYRQLWKDLGQVSSENKMIKEQLRKETNKAFNRRRKVRQEKEYMKTNKRGDYELLQKTNETLQSEVNRLNGKKFELQKQLQKLSDDNQNLSEELQLSKESSNKQDPNKLLRLEESILKLKNEIVQMSHVQQALKKDLELEKANALIKENEHIQNSSHLQRTIQEQTQEISHLKVELQSRVEDTSHSRNNKFEKRPEKENHSNEEILLQLEDTRKRLIKVQQELDDTKSRLSRAVGDKLTDNNPNIADLSDKNRPTNISERFQELYDNQWTDAFEIINKTREDEEQTINTLRIILEDAMKFCTTEAANQMMHIKESFLMGEELPSNMRKQVKDCRKAMAELYGRGLYRNYWTALRNSQSEEASLAMKVPDYVKECFEICWLMAVQDHPVVFGAEIRHNDDFNKDHYKAYTKAEIESNILSGQFCYFIKTDLFFAKGLFKERKCKDCFLQRGCSRKGNVKIASRLEYNKVFILNISFLRMII